MRPTPSSDGSWQLHSEKQAREDESDRHFRLLADSSPVALWVTDAQGNIEFINQTYKRFFGIYEDAVTDAKAWVPLVHPDHMASYVGGFLDAVAQEAPFHGECRVRHADGSWRWISTSAVPRFSAGGAFLGHVGSSTDTTALKEAEERLRASESLLRLATEGARVGTFEKDLRTGRGWWSPVAMKLLGIERSQFTRSDWLETVHADDRARVAQAWKAAIEDGTAYEVEYRTAAGTEIGEPRWLLARGQIERDADGKTMRGAGVLLDVSKRMRVQRELAEQRSRELTYLEHMPIGVWFISASGQITFGNRAGQDIWAGAKYVPLEQFGEYKARWHRTGIKLRPEDWAAARAIRHGETSINEELDIECFDGVTRRTILNSVVPTYDAEGKIAGAVVINQDITARLRDDAAIRDANRRKDEFLATLAHELRNPLAPLRNSLHLLKMGGADASVQQRVVEVMERQVAHMVRLVDDLLEVSRISSGKIELRREVVPLSQAVGDAVESVAPLVEAQGHKLTVDVSAEPIPIHADAVRIAQVITNLLNNAVKYTERGGHIKVRAFHEGADAVVSVEDNGAGIPEHMLSRVFDLFTQVDRTLGRAQGGLGIGLALVKHLVQLHGGTVCARSDGAGRGSEFIVRLPLAQGQGVEAIAAQEMDALPRVAGKRILVCDDNVDAAESLAALLKGQGNEVRITYEGTSCIQAADEFEPDVVLLDIGLPGMTGYEVASRLRSRPWASRAIFVAITGWGREEDRQRALEAGYDHHIVKPVEPVQLLHVLARLLDGAGTSDRKDQPPPLAS